MTTPGPLVGPAARRGQLQDPTTGLEENVKPDRRWPSTVPNGGGAKLGGQEAGRLRADFSSEDLVLLLMANAGVIAATGDAAPDA